MAVLILDHNSYALQVELGRVSKLADLLRNRMRMLREDASAVAKVVEEAFHGASELDDDTLDPMTRQVFYDLQDENILSVRRMEYEQDGRRMRGYFWRVEDAQRDLSPRRSDAPEPMDDLYGSLRDDAWNRRPLQ